MKYTSEIYHDPNKTSNLPVKLASPTVFLISVTSNSIHRCSRQNFRVILADSSPTCAFHAESFRKPCWSSLKRWPDPNNFYPCHLSQSPVITLVQTTVIFFLGYEDDLLTGLPPNWYPCFHNCSVFQMFSVKGPSDSRKILVR